MSLSDDLRECKSWISSRYWNMEKQKMTIYYKVLLLLFWTKRESPGLDLILFCGIHHG